MSLLGRNGVEEGVAVGSGGCGEVRKLPPEVVEIVEADLQAAVRESDGGREAGDAAGKTVVRSGDGDLAGRGVLFGAEQGIGGAGAASVFAGDFGPAGIGFQGGEEVFTANGGGVAYLERGGEAEKDLAGAAFLDAEERLDGVAVEEGGLGGAEGGEDAIQVSEPGGFGWHERVSLSILC